MSGSSDSVRRVMRVGWFDRRKGYGFLVPTNQALESDSQDDTLFVHHNQIRTMYMKNIYRMLYAGEYVECEVGKDSNDRTVALNVAGIQDGPLMCEVRSMNDQRTSTDGDEGGDRAATTRPARGGGAGRGRGRGRGGGRGGARGGGAPRATAVAKVADTSGMDA